VWLGDDDDGVNLLRTPGGLARGWGEGWACEGQMSCVGCSGQAVGYIITSHPSITKSRLDAGNMGCTRVPGDGILPVRVLTLLTHRPQTGFQTSSPKDV
jgi:hypothetical protein